MINGPQTYAKLSSVAKEFLKRKHEIVRPKLLERYEYLGAGANLTGKAVETESQIHKFLSQSAVTETVRSEFGKAIDFLG